MTDDELRARVAELPHWWHSMELRPGIVTPGRKSVELMREEAGIVFQGLSLAGRSVLDIGAWNGHFSFDAARRGAARVVAADHFVWHSPEIQGRRSFELAREALGLGALVEPLDLDVPDITPGIGRFDVTLFLGVFYHLFDPMDAMRRVADVTTGCLVVETHQDAQDQARPMMVFYPGDTLGGDATNWFCPNPPMMLELLRELGFARIMYRPHPLFAAAHGRGFYAAFRADAPAGLDSGDWAGWIDLADPAQRSAAGLPVRSGARTGLISTRRLRRWWRRLRGG
jgi:tRNA (mo5U34)-methyltransferase